MPIPYRDEIATTPVPPSEEATGRIERLSVCTSQRLTLVVLAPSWPICARSPPAAAVESQGESAYCVVEAVHNAAPERRAPTPEHHRNIGTYGCATPLHTRSAGAPSRRAALDDVGAPNGQGPSNHPAAAPGQRLTSVASGNARLGQDSVNLCLLELPQNRESPGQPMVADGEETAGELRGERRSACRPSGGPTETICVRVRYAGSSMVVEPTGRAVVWEPFRMDRGLHFAVLRGCQMDRYGTVQGPPWNSYPMGQGFAGFERSPDVNMYHGPSSCLKHSSRNVSGPRSV